MRLMLDECMGTKASRVFAELLKLHKPPIEAHFLEDYLGGKKGVLDRDWSSILASEGDWAVITCDYRRPRGQKEKLKGPPLQLILPSKKITGFYLGGKMAQLSGFEKFRAVVCTFPEVWHQAQTAPPGTRYKVVPTGTAYRVEEWPLKAALPDSV